MRHIMRHREGKCPTNWGLSRCLLGEVPPSGAGDFGLGPKVTKGPPKPKVSDFLYANLAAKEMAFKH